MIEEILRDEEILNLIDGIVKNIGLIQKTIKSQQESINILIENQKEILKLYNLTNK